MESPVIFVDLAELSRRRREVCMERDGDGKVMQSVCAISPPAFSARLDFFFASSGIFMGDRPLTFSRTVGTLRCFSLKVRD
jgi:hypothetical protein